MYQNGNRNVEMHLVCDALPAWCVSFRNSRRFSEMRWLLRTWLHALSWWSPPQLKQVRFILRATPTHTRIP